MLLLAAVVYMQCFKTLNGLQGEEVIMITVGYHMCKHSTDQAMIKIVTGRKKSTITANLHRFVLTAQCIHLEGERPEAHYRPIIPFEGGLR